MASTQTVQVGGLTLTLSKLTLGQLRQDDALRAAVAGMAGVAKVARLENAIPSGPQLDAMLLIAAAAARQNDPSITAEAITAAFDAEGFDTGFTTLAQCIAVAVRGATILPKTPTGDTAPGEADSPSNLTLVDSTG